MVRHYIPRNRLHIIHRPSLPKLCLEFKYCQNTTKHTQINQVKKINTSKKIDIILLKLYIRQTGYYYKVILLVPVAKYCHVFHWYRDGTCHIKLQVLSALRLQGLGVRSLLVRTQYQDYRVLACSRTGAQSCLLPHPAIE